ncbi:acyltransferase family protein [Corynebacterium pelargi]|uniref:O-acetyltransferase OatA n=1 Tax=Corynebacterium pelargi TaxID=1471400 RepID=A0A410W6C6_9CORY|nr:acyltransferase [Corynebacterium pelargi]QAU51512.1 O-acetyltransferase OatA [Corynebacterium pelargi]GGG79687.1 acyltransferase [Corynebacterium pelargi]
MSSSYLPQLEGLRGVAALGVLLTHTAFQTGTQSAVLARFDYFVAVFFALSAFLLWRDFRPQGYLRRRFWRIVPAYWVCVGLTFALLFDAFRTPPEAILATFFFGQIYLPNGLAGGLTHMWSLCVEVAFYLGLPVLFWAVGKREKKVRVGVIVALMLFGFAWTLMPWPEGGVNFQIFPFSYLPWFGVGLLLAEFEPKRASVWFWVPALVVAWIAGQMWFGPLGLDHPSPLQFFRKILFGALFGLFVMLAAWNSRLLRTEPLQWLGRISYSLFLWHLPVLSIVLPMLGIKPFSGHFVLVSAVTIVMSIAVADLSYRYVETKFSARGRRKVASRP